MFNFKVPFFRPLWVRLLVVAICIGWGIFELMGGSVGFAMIFLAAGIYATYGMFIAFDPSKIEDEENKAGKS